MTRPLDVLVLGAGLAGLSLGARLADGPLRAVLVDPRTSWDEDRTWCWFDRPGAGPQQLVSARWRRWRVSTADGRTVVHEGGRQAAYHRVDARTVYDHALDRIAAAPRVDLAPGVAAGRVTPRADGLVEVATDAGTLVAHAVVDTRPPDRARTLAAPLLQVFLGVEVEVPRPWFDASTAGLMERLTSDDHGLRFDYVLPTSPTTALVEATRFAPAPVPRAVLEDDLDAAVAAATDGAGVAERGRTEGGMLPMGLDPAPPTPPGVVRAGVGGGALRPATGYGFRRTLAWAEACAASLHAGGPALGHPSDPPVLAAMDATFLRAVREHPARAVDWFHDLAAGLPASAYARFLSERATPRDLLRVVATLPPLPFARALVPA